MENLFPSAVVELLDGPHQAEIPLLHEVGETEATPHVTPGYRHHKTKIRFDHVESRGFVAQLDAFCQGYLFVRRE